MPQLLKLRGNSWRLPWQRRVEDKRAAEMQSLVKMRLLDALNVFVGGLCGLAIPVSIFAWFALVQKRTLDATTAFTAGGTEGRSGAGGGGGRSHAGTLARLVPGTQHP